jgi:putative addiction module killer protein
VYQLQQTVSFQKWLKRISDAETKARLVRRIERLRCGNLGDHRSLGGGLLELREHFGPGYRIYVTFVSGRVIGVLYGGDKRTQWRDIAQARKLIDGNGGEA